MHSYRFLGFLLGIFLCLFPTISPLAQTSADVEFRIGASAEFFVLHKYPKLKGHKAVAVGPGGYWANIYGASSAGLASKGALRLCNQDVLQFALKSIRHLKCVLFDVNGKPTGKAAPTGIPFGIDARGDDYPWQFGQQWNATVPNRRGTMLLVHGCDGYTLNGWMMSWVNYYRAAGFRVILPNSFAEAREPDVCGKGGEQINRQTRNVKLRVAQTLRTLAGLRKKYPGEPIYLHGHSEGGWTVQALGQKVDGIIVTGSPCGFGGSQAYLSAKDVPILVIAGTKDHAFRAATGAKALSRYCRDVVGAGKLTWVSVPKMDHYAAIWWPEVQAAVGKFLNVPLIKIRRPKADGIAYPKLSSIGAQQYGDARKHKVLAASKDGAWSWVGGEGNLLDAEELALFNCDVELGADLFRDADQMHRCALVDVNGKRLTDMK